MKIAQLVFVLGISTSIAFVATAQPHAVHRAPMRHRDAGASVDASASADVLYAPLDAIAARLEAESPAFQTCFAEGVRRDDRLRGTVTLHVRVSTQGRVESVSSERTVEARDPAHELDATLMDLVAACIESHVRTVDFGAIDGGAVRESTVPLHFEP